MTKIQDVIDLLRKDGPIDVPDPAWRYYRMEKAVTMLQEIERNQTRWIPVSESPLDATSRTTGGADMTVAELIEVLKKYAQDLDVKVYEVYDGELWNITEQSIYFDEMKDAVIFRDRSRS